VTGTDAFDSEYEAHYRLIDVWEADLYRWMASCSDSKCRWMCHVAYSSAQARDAGLAHCREKHVRMTRW
jgi:hypothetical protein